jgi:hypothetical protein
MPDFVHKWSSIGLSTKSLDHEIIERRIREAYRISGRREPDRCVWLKSPVLGAIGYLMLRELGNAKEPGWELFGKSLSLPAAFPNVANMKKLKANVSHEVLSILTKNMADVVNNRVYNLIDATISNAVLSALSSKLAAHKWENATDILGAAIDGHAWERIRLAVLNNLHSLSSLVFRDGLGKEVPIDLRCLNDYLSQICGLSDAMVGVGLDETEPSVWWWPFERVCLLAERYTELHQDENFMLHSLREPSVTYADGWAIYCLHGIVVEPWVVQHPSRLTPQIILSERSPVVRGVLLGVYGDRRFSEDTRIDLLPLDRYTEWASGPGSDQIPRVGGFRGRGSVPPLYLVRENENG